MLYTAVVEDDAAEAGRIAEYLDRYAAEKGLEIRYDVYENAFLFMEGYHHQYDIVFMDIQMPQINGMEAAVWLRTVDRSVALIFVTSLAQYAVKSYEVEALDYILKPVNYAAFALKLRRAVERCGQRGAEMVIRTTGDGLIRIPAGEVKYIEIFEHHLRYRTERGDYSGYGTLKQVEQDLPETGFYRCNNQTIVNLRFVERYEDGMVYADGRAFDVSRNRKKGFLEALHGQYR